MVTSDDFERFISAVIKDPASADGIISNSENSTAKNRKSKGVKQRKKRFTGFKKNLFKKIFIPTPL